METCKPVFHRAQPKKTHLKPYIFNTYHSSQYRVFKVAASTKQMSINSIQFNYLLQILKLHKVLFISEMNIPTV